MDIIEMEMAPSAVLSCCLIRFRCLEGVDLGL